jgi:septal ring factor EnvC (AmiA/AmiB activator)
VAVQRDIEATLRLKDSLSKNIHKANKSLRSLNKQVERNQKELKKIGKSVGFLNLAKSIIGANVAMRAFSAVFRTVRDELTSMIDASSRAVEVQNLFSVSFGDMADAAEEWASRTSAAIGVNDTTLKEMSGTLFNMVSAMGISKDAVLGRN